MISRKTIWSKIGFGDFYNELSIKILEICNKKRSRNGGIMKISDAINDY